MSAAAPAAAAGVVIVEIISKMLALALSRGGQDILLRFLSDHGITSDALDVAMATRPHVQNRPPTEPDASPG